MKNKLLFLFILIGGLALWQTTTAVENYLEKRHHYQRLAHLNTRHLDLPHIINFIDDIGGNYQLNWKEIVAIVGVEQYNMLYTISEDRLTDVAMRFLENGSILSFKDVVTTSFDDEAAIARAHQYLEDLAFVGYVPERLHPDSMEAQFIAQLVEPAKENFHETGILPSITIAQAILDSNWGQTSLSLQAYNLFGVRADSYWDGSVAPFEASDSNGLFRKYNDWAEAIADHAYFLSSNPSYIEAGVFQARTYGQQAQALQDAGHSKMTDEHGNLIFARTIGELIRQFNLQLLDHAVQIHQEVHPHT